MLMGLDARNRDPATGESAMSYEEKALEVFGKPCNCGQAIMVGFAPRFGLEPELARGLGRSLGGGLGRLGLVCGAVSAAMILLGLASEAPGEEHPRRDASYRAVRDFAARFRELHGAIDCRTLLGVEVGSEEGQAEAKARGLFVNRCPLFVRDAARILTGMLDEKAPA